MREVKVKGHSDDGMSYTIIDGVFIIALLLGGVLDTLNDEVYC